MLRLRPWALAVLIALLALVLRPADAAAQRRLRGGGLFRGPIEAGLRAGRDFENHAWSLGAQFGLHARKFEFRPSGDWFFPRHGDTGWQLNGDAAIHLGQGGGLYAGGGVALVHLDDTDGTKTGYNLFFGLSTAPPAERLKGFAEFRWTFYHDTSPFRLALGFMYALTGL
jgi:opacity protein-like surface antigen